MGRLFSILLLAVIMHVPAGNACEAYERPVFFSMLFPQLIPEWMFEEKAEVMEL